MLSALELAKIAVKALDSKKARDIKLLETKDITVISEYFIICTAGSSAQIKALSDEVDKALSAEGEPALRTEGYRDGGWVLIDFGCLVVHLFTDEMRKFYNLEHLWHDAPMVDISGLLAE